MELARTVTKQAWLDETKRTLLERRKWTERKLLRFREGVACAEYAQRADLVARFEVKMMETTLELKNIRWALSKIEKGEVY